MIQKWTRKPYKVYIIWKKHRVHESNKFYVFHEHNGEFFWKTIGDHTVIVGRKTWESAKNYFLKRRPTAKHIIVTSKPDNQETENCIFVKSIEEALSFNDNLMFICGGSKVYDSVKNYVNVAIETVIDGEYECDSYAPKWLNDMTPFVEFDLLTNEEQPKAHVYIRYWSK